MRRPFMYQNINVTIKNSKTSWVTEYGQKQAHEWLNPETTCWAKLDSWIELSKIIHLNYFSLSCLDTK